MTWVLVVDDNFTRANTSLGTVGNSWTDEAGNVYKILSNKLNGVANASGFRADHCLRPGGEDRDSSRMVLEAIPSTFATQYGAILRHISGEQFYLASVSCTSGASAATVKIFRYVSSTLVQIGATQNYTYTFGDTYELDFSALGVSPTALSVVLTDVTSATQVVSYSTTDSNSTLQVTGSFAIEVNSGTTNFTRARTYYGIALTSDTPSLGKNWTGKVVTLSGSNTTWLSSTPTFTLSGGTGASITSQSIISDSSATITIDSGSTVDTLIITDPSTAETTNISVVQPTMSVNPSLISVNSTGNLIVLTGVNTQWLTQNPTISLSGGTGASITHQTLTNDTHITVTVSAGSAAGALTLTDPVGSQTATVSVSTDQLTTNSNLFWSPYNWLAGTSAGVPYSLSVNPGAYVKTTFTGNNFQMRVDVSSLVTLSASDYPYIWYSIDGAQFNETQLTSSSALVTLASSLATSGPHTMEIHIKSLSGTYDRWVTPLSALKIIGFLIDDTAVLSTSTLQTNRAILYGDSITEGSNIDSATYAGHSALKTFARAIAVNFQTEYGIIGFGGQGYTNTGGGSVPPLYNISAPSSSAWDNIVQGQSRLVSGLFSPAPDYIFLFHGTNDMRVSQDPTRQVTALLALLRTAAPTAMIFVCVPPGYWSMQQISNGYYLYEASRLDNGVHFVDIGNAMQFALGQNGASTISIDGLHPNTIGHTEATSRYMAILGSYVGRRTQVTW